MFRQLELVYGVEEFQSILLKLQSIQLKHHFEKVHNIFLSILGTFGRKSRKRTNPITSRPCW